MNCPGPDRWIDDHLAELKQPYLALHDDGYVLWKVDADWGDVDAEHTLKIIDLVASTRRRPTGRCGRS